MLSTVLAKHLLGPSLTKRLLGRWGYHSLVEYHYIVLGALTCKADLRDRPVQLIVSARCSLAPFDVWLPTAPERAVFFKLRWTSHAGRPCCSRPGAAPAQQQRRFSCGVFDPKANRLSFGIAQGR